MRSACPWHIHNSPLAGQGAAFTGLEALAIASTVGSIGMSIMGGVQQSEAQREAGDTAYRNALIRQQQMEQQAAVLRNDAIRKDNEARQREAIANDQQAAAQREAIERNRKARIAAGRAQSVMAASGAGVDTSIIAGILGEGEYAGDVALYGGDVKARDSRYQASLDRYDADNRRFEADNRIWRGQTDVAEGLRTKSIMDARAGSTLAMGIGKGLFSGASLAAKYGGDLFGSDYDLGSDTMRTSGDADLGGYSRGQVDRYDNLRVY